MLTCRNRALALAALIVANSTWCASASATDPVYIRQTGNGNPILCTSDTTPATYDAGATATSKIIFLSVGNPTDATVTDVTITLTGSDVPSVFSVYYNQYPSWGSLPAYKGFAYYVKFAPRAEDSSGTVYGGDASKAVIRITYNFKPKKGKKQAGTPLELILVGRKS